MVKGSLVWVSLDPARGAEVPKTRPCIVVSRTEANDISSTVTIVPLSSVRGRAVDRLVQPLLSAKETHLPKDSRALCDQVRTIDKGRIRETAGVLAHELVGFVGSRPLHAILGWAPMKGETQRMLRLITVYTPTLPKWTDPRTRGDRS